MLVLKYSLIPRESAHLVSPKWIYEVCRKWQMEIGMPL
ncbi:hypothetical protein E24_00221 [Faustovirus]|nr:hypothetical protein E24_00221 [Faustovirus]AMN84129.1 hypothetical protein D5a_00219 [Faustovirus]AMN85118.1 hypothetical protein E23_00220 [Faustovirus]